MGKTLLFLTLLSIILQVSTPITPECQAYVDKLIEEKDIADIPINSILYSGLAINGVGQFEECRLANYNYFLVYTPAKTAQLPTFTGLCIPPQCTVDDVEQEASFFNSVTYSYESDKLDALAWIGIVLFLIYVLFVIVMMSISSLRADNEEGLSSKVEVLESSPVSDINMSINSKGSLLPRASKEIQEFQQKGIVEIFDGYQHYCKIFQISPKKNILSGLKVMSVFMVIVSTEYSFRQTVAQNNYKAQNLLSSSWGYMISNLDLTYTVLFWIAGVATAYALYKIDSFTDMFKQLFTKLLKLWPLLLLFTLFAYGLSESLISRPLLSIWQKTNTQDCTKIIWRKWFLINNLIPDGSVCLPWTWLIEAELFLFLLAPLFMIIHKTRRGLGYGLLLIMVVLSSVCSYTLLNYKDIQFFPALLLNNEREFVYDYQMSPLVRAGNYFFGLMVGIFFVNGLEKIDHEEARTNEYKMAKAIKRSKAIQAALQVTGLALCTLCYWLIAAVENWSQEARRVWLVLSQIGMCLGLSLLICPSVFGGDGIFTRILNKILGHNVWSPLEKISNAAYLMAPLVIGFTTYCLQASVYYSYESIFLLLIGDIVLTLITSILVTACLESPVSEAHKQIDHYIFGHATNESVVVIED